MKRLLFSLAIVIGSVALGNAEVIAADNSWKLGNVAKELVIETNQENNKQACGSTSGVFTIDITYIENDSKNNGNAVLDCWLDMQLPKAIVSKTTAINFEKYVKKAYFEILVNKTWLPIESSGFFDKTQTPTSWEFNSLRINYYGPPELVKGNCTNYKEKSTYQTRAVVILNKQAKKLYSKPFTVSYGNHPQEWLRTCSISSVNTPIPVESTGDATGQQNISCLIIGQPVKYDFVQDPPYEDDRTITLKISNSSSCAITVAVSGQVICQHRPAALQSIQRYNRTILFSKVTSNIFKPKTSGFVTISTLFPSNSVTYKDCDRSPIPIEPQTKLPTKSKLLGPYLVYDTGKDTLKVLITTAEKQ